VVGGSLQTNGGDHLVIVVPYRPTTPNYAIEFHLQIMRLPRQGGGFLIATEKTPAAPGYRAGILRLHNPGSYPNGLHAQAQVYLDPMDATEPGSFEPIDYEPGFQWHTYRVEVRGPWARFFIDDTAVSDATSSRTASLSNGPIELSSSAVVLRVNSFHISAL
jgi:hypothetical protein